MLTIKTQTWNQLPASLKRTRKANPDEQSATGKINEVLFGKPTNEGFVREWTRVDITNN